MNRCFRRSAIFLAAVLAAAPAGLISPLLAATAAIHGTVKDTLGAVIVGAKVELVQSGNAAASTTTDAQGDYALAVPAAGRYQVRASAQSFSPQVSESIYLSAAGGARIDLVLSPGVLPEEITVTATGTPVPEAQLGNAVTVLPMGQHPYALSIQQPLRLVPGLQLSQAGQAGGSTFLYIRGGNSDANKVLIDGIPTSFIGGLTDFAAQPATAISSVEILRGPNSALYGSDALAGVVSMTTDRGTTRVPELTLAADGGNFGTSHQEGTLGGAVRQFDYFSDFSVFNTRNDVPNDAFHNATYAGNFGWTPRPATSLRLTVRHVANHGAVPNAIDFFGIPDDTGQTDRDTYVGATFENQPTARWHNLARYGGERLHEVFYDYAPTGTAFDAFGEGFPTWYIGAPVTVRGANGYTVSGQAVFQYPGTYPNQSISTARRDFVYAQSDFRFTQHLVGLVGFKYEDESGKSLFTGTPSQSVDRGNYSYTMQLAGDLFNRLYYTLGSGIEKNELFGVEATPRASLAYYLMRPSGSGFFSGTKARASFGKGIKEPSLYQQLSSLYALLQESGESSLISQFHVSPVGAQRSRNYDGGVDQEFLNGRARLGITYFHNEFTNGVEYVPQQGLVALGIPADVAQAAAFGAYVNSMDFRAQGVEAELEYKINSNFMARGGYTYLDAVVQRSFSSDALSPSFNPNFPTTPIGVYSPLVGARPFRRAPHSGYFQVNYSRARWFGSLTGTFVSRRDDSDFLYDQYGGNTMLLPNRNLAPAYQRIDLSGSYRVNRFVQVYSSMQNLFSQHYTETFGYPSLPFTLRAGIKLTLGGESWK
ncbi:MAG TPA: TonB-dependent receptor [Terriglobales bacterium]|nr:TonB-dependent receptor [Terriglobales bacterium]